MSNAANYFNRNM